MFSINIEDRSLSHDGTPIDLSPKPFLMLLYFVSNPRQLLTTEDILKGVWPDSIVTPDSVKDYVAVIRRALNDSANNSGYIETVRGVGYRFIGDITIAGDSSVPAQVLFRSIPAELTPFIGRREELQKLSGIFAKNNCRLLSLQGPGGIGKTRLANALLRELAMQGVKQHDPGYEIIAAISLSSIQPNPEHVVQAIAAAIEVSLHHRQSGVEQIAKHLAGRRAVLLLDNAEHLTEQLKVCIDLLQQLPLLKLLVTSRVPTELYGEWSYSVPGLSLNKDKPHVEADAVKLLISCAARALPGVEVTEQDAAVIAEICHRLNGIPLAIEICAPWVQKMSFAEILHSMKSGMSVMKGIKPIAGYQDNSIARIMSQHWHALSEQERTAFAALSLFSVEFSLEAALYVTGCAAATLRDLENKFMLVRQADERFSQHPVMREYGRNWLAQHDIEHQFTRRYLEYYVALAENTDKNILSGEQFMLIQALSLEHQNFRAALQVCLENEDHPINGRVMGLRLAGGLCMFWFLGNHWAEGEEWARHFIALNSESSPYIARALLTRGGLAALNDNLSVADECMSRAVDTALVHGPSYLYGRTLSGLGLVRRLQGRYDEAIALCEESLVVFRDVEDDGSSLVSLGCIGQAYSDMGEYQMAVETFTQGVQLSLVVGNTFNLPHAVVNLARSHLALGQIELTHSYLQQYMPMLNEMGFLLYIAQALNVNGWLNVSENNPVEAQQCFATAAEHYLKLGDRTGLAESLEGIAAASCGNGDYQLAQTYLSASYQQSEDIMYDTPGGYRQLMGGVERELQNNLSPEQMALSKRIGQSVTPALLLAALDN